MSHNPETSNQTPHTHHVSRLAFYLTGYTLPVALFLFLFAIYLLTYTPQINSSDGQAMFATAESLVRRGALDIEQIRWMGLQQGTYGLDGLLYSRKGIGVSLALLPLTWLGLVVPGFGPVGVSLLFNAIVTALTAVLLLAYLQALGFSRRIGLIVALTFGLASLAWPYAKSLFSDPLAGLLLLAAAYVLLKLRLTLTVAEAENDLAPASQFTVSTSLIVLFGYPFLAGLFLGWNVATRYAEAVVLPVYGLLLLYYLGPGHGNMLAMFRLRLPTRNFWLPIFAFSAPVLLIGLGLIGYNVSRYGDPFNTGYLPNETFSAVLWQGLAGQLISPGRGLLLFCPIFILSLGGLPAFFRRYRAEAMVAVAVILVHLLLYGKWFMWHGGFAWGPRFMIPTLPFWAIFLAPVARRAFDQGGALKLVFVSLAALGLIPQLLSVAIDSGPYQAWLLDTGLPLFAPRTFFDPQYSPFLQAWGFITGDVLDLAWAWHGQINGWLLAALLINIIITGFYLKRQAPYDDRLSHGRLAGPNALLGLSILAIGSTLLAVIFLLVHTHRLPARSLQTAIEVLNANVRPDDAVITNDPEIALDFAERYKGRAPVLGLNNGGVPLPEDVNRRLADTIAQHQQIWWLPNWLPSADSAIEQTLRETGLQARNDSFGSQRLALFVFPTDLSATSTHLTFADLINLTEIARPDRSAGGAALPIELHWQVLAPIDQDYHVFIHLLAADGHLIAQTDGQPAQWTRPTSTWTVGETVIDRHGLWIPPQAEPGSYELLVGLYRPADNERLHLPDGSDAARFQVTIR